MHINTYVYKYTYASTIRSLFNQSIRLCNDNSTLLKKKLKLIKNFHVKLDYPLHVLYDKYNACVANLTDKLIFYGPHKPIIHILYRLSVTCRVIKLSV